MSSKTDYYFPFYKLGLQRNPFGTLTPDEWFAVTVLPQPVEAALADGFEHLLVLGDKGRGKSTTLRWLETYYRKQGYQTAYERIPRWQWYYTTDMQPLDVFVLDEAQRLQPWTEWRLFRQRGARRLIVGSHRDITVLFRMQGLNVTTVRLNRTASRGRLAQILERRLAVFALDGEPGVQFSEAAVDMLWSRFGSDLRSMNFHLYEVFEQLQQPGDITPQELAAIMAPR